MCTDAGSAPPIGARLPCLGRMLKHIPRPWPRLGIAALLLTVVAANHDVDNGSDGSVIMVGKP